MITISGTVSGTVYVATLPWAADWSIRIAKPAASRMSLAGSMIHQTGTKNITAGEVSYSGMVPTADAAALESLDRGAATCTLSDGENVYEVSLDATVGRHVSGGRMRVDFTARIIRELYA